MDLCRKRYDITRTSDHPAPKICKVADSCRQVLGPVVYVRPVVLIRQRPQQGCTARKPLLSNFELPSALGMQIFTLPVVIAEIRGSAAL
jgi:hypothetical protein